jgi:hypothetical protein
MMERYREISLADLCELILKNELDEVFFQGITGNLLRHEDRRWNLKELSNYKWFVREVLE